MSNSLSYRNNFPTEETVEVKAIKATEFLTDEDIDELFIPTLTVVVNLEGDNDV